MTGAEETWAERAKRVFAKIVESNRTISRRLEAFYKCVESGERPARSEYPERVLNPTINGAVSLLDELGCVLRHYQPGTMPPEVANDFATMMNDSMALVESLEGIARFTSLNRAYAVETDLFRYMTSASPQPVTPRQHATAVNRKLEQMRQSFSDNSDASYDLMTESMCRSEKGRLSDRQRRTIARLDRNVQMLIRRGGEDATECTHCWDRLSRIRRAQVRTVWLWLQDPRRARREIYTLSRGCDETWQFVTGGYPTAKALYSFCHAHINEFL